MKTLQNSSSLWEAINSTVEVCDPFVSSPETKFTLRDLLAGSVLGGRCQELSGSSVLISTTDQIVAAAALIELDGVARRIVFLSLLSLRKQMRLFPTGSAKTLQLLVLDLSFIAMEESFLRVTAPPVAMRRNGCC
jgi:hypothetical protein